MKGKLTYTKRDFAARAQQRPAVERKRPAAAEDPAYAAWSQGTSLKALVQQYGGSRSAMRKRLTTAAGGKDNFRTLRAQGAGGKTVPFGGKRATPRTRDTRAQDDALVPRISSDAIRHTVSADVIAYSRRSIPKLQARLRETDDAVGRAKLTTELTTARALVKTADTPQRAGWTSAYYPTALGTALRLTDTDGTAYVRARENERADVIVTLAALHTQQRYKREADAVSTKQAKREAALIARGNAKHAIVRTRTRAARAARRHK